MKPVASQSANTRIFRDYDRDQQTGAERRPVVDHGGERIGSGEQRQRQRHADQPERDSPDRRAKDRPIAETSGEPREDRDRGHR